MDVLVLPFPWLVLAGEYSLKGDADVQRQVRLHIGMGLASAGVCQLGRHHVSGTSSGGAVGLQAGQQIAGGRGVVGGCRVGAPYMRMRWHFSHRKSVGLFSPFTSLDVPGAHVDGRAPLQVRQGESRPSVATVGGAQEREEGLVLVDW